MSESVALSMLLISSAAPRVGHPLSRRSRRFAAHRRAAVVASRGPLALRPRFNWMQLGIDRLRRERRKAQGGADMPQKRPQPTLRGSRHEVRLHCEAPFRLAGGVALRSARRIEVWLHAWLKSGPGARSREDDGITPAVRASFVASARAYGARGRRDVREAGFFVWPAQDRTSKAR
jgi:hypothetical protein